MRLSGKIEITWQSFVCGFSEGYPSGGGGSGLLVFIILLSTGMIS